jgi:hypothetical protein
MKKCRWINRQTVSAFIAGMAVTIIFMAGIIQLVNPSFLTGGMRSVIVDTRGYYINPDNGEILRYIGVYAFYQCTNLSSVVIKDGVKKIYPGAFEGCSNLLRILIPNCVTEIGSDTFKKCTLVGISGYRGSCAEKYAQKYGIPFSVIE